MMIKLGLIRFSWYGGQIYRSLKKYYADTLTVTAVYDISDRKYYSGGKDLYACEEIVQAYRAGVFEQVLLAVADPAIYSQWENVLQAYGIGIYTLTGTEEETSAPEQILTGEDLPEATELHVFSDVFAVCTNHTDSDLLYFYHQGKAVRDNYYQSDVNWQRALLNAPLDPGHLPEADEVHTGEYFCASRLWGKNYGHFVLQELSLIYLMEYHRNFQGRYIVPRTRFAEEYLELLGIPQDRILWQDDLAPEKIYRFEKMIFLYQSGYEHWKMRTLVLEMAEVLKKAAGCDDLSDCPKRLFVQRKHNRRVLNAEKRLKRRGFETWFAEEHTVREQIRCFAGAEIVACATGAASINSIYMHRHACFIEMFNKARVMPWCTETLYEQDVYYIPFVEMPIFDADHSRVNDDYYIHGIILDMLLKQAEILTEGKHDE